jgi:hypothetical protein
MRVKHCTVTDSIASTIDPPDNLMASPTSRPRDLVAALGAEPTLAYPQTKQLLPPFRIGFQLQVKPMLEVNVSLIRLRV